MGEATKPLMINREEYKYVPSKKTEWMKAMSLKKQRMLRRFLKVFCSEVLPAIDYFLQGRQLRRNV